MSYSTLNTTEIVKLETNLNEILNNELLGILITLNRNEQLSSFLDMIGHLDLLDNDENEFKPLLNRKILVLGDSKIKANDIFKTIQNCGIDKDRIELNLNYKLDNLDIESLKYNFNYSLILIGPVPHSFKGKDSYSSIITRMEKEIGFPPVFRLNSTNELKITKTAIKETIQQALKQKKIVA
jgi:hypothetical protein